MNRTNFEHVAVALVHQVVIGLIFGNWWAGAALGCGIFIGREFAQCERRVLLDLKLPTLAEAHQQGYFPELMCYKKEYWDLDSLMDMCLPMAFCLPLAWSLS